MVDKRLNPNREKRVKGTLAEENERINRDFKQLKRQGWTGSKLRMHLAQKYKRPILEINIITEQDAKVKAKQEAAQRKQEEAEKERKRIEDLGVHGFEPEFADYPRLCTWCREPYTSKRHELKQERLV